ncbi:hypothetical protein D3C78_984890 [compost metagenome]
MQTRGGVFHFRAAVAVNDARFAALLLHVTQELIQRLEFFHQHVADIGAIEAADLDKRIVKSKKTDDILAGRVVSRGGKRHKR